MPITKNAQLAGPSSNPVWCVRWRPNKFEVASCSGRQILLWGFSERNQWDFKCSIYNELEHIREPAVEFINEEAPLIESSAVEHDQLASPGKETGNPVKKIVVSRLRPVNAGAHERTVRSIAWSPDGRFLAAASFDSTISIWRDRNEADESLSNPDWYLVTKIEGHESEVKCAHWHPTKPLLASCGRDKTIWIHAALSADCTEFACAAVLNGHTQDVKHVLWHPYLDAVISASYDNTVKVWVPRSVVLENPSLRGLTCVENGDPDGDWLCLKTLDNASNTIWSVSFALDGSRLISSDGEGIIYVWECPKSATASPCDAPSQSQKDSPKENELIKSVEHCESSRIQNAPTPKIGSLSTAQLATRFIYVSGPFRGFPSDATPTGFSDGASHPCQPYVMGAHITEKPSEWNPHDIQSGNTEPAAKEKEAKNGLGFESLTALENPTSLQPLGSQPVYSVSHHPERNLIAAGGDGVAVLENSGNQWVVRCYEDSHEGDVNCVDWCHKGNDGSRYLASAGDDGFVFIYSYDS